MDFSAEEKSVSSGFQFFTSECLLSLESGMYSIAENAASTAIPGPVFCQKADNEALACFAERKVKPAMGTKNKTSVKLAYTAKPAKVTAKARCFLEWPSEMNSQECQIANIISPIPSP